jgi:hypothetical protein
MKNKSVVLKKILLILCCLNFSFFLNAVDSINCLDYDYEKSFKFINKKGTETMSFKNPFDKDRCFHIFKDRHDLIYLDPSLLDYKDNLIEFHNNDSDSIPDGPNVTMYKSSLRYYYFLYFSKNDHEYKRFKALFKKKRSSRKYFTEFLFIHELIHLNYKITFGSFDITEKESISDIGSIMYLSYLHNMNIDETISLAKSIYSVRNKSVSKTREHLNKKTFKNYIKYLKYLKTNNINYYTKNLVDASNLALKINRNESIESIVKNFK